MGKRIRTRGIGERFEMGGVMYEVAEAPDADDACRWCSLKAERGLVCRGDVGVTGLCYSGVRSDNKQVVFVEVVEE